MLPNASQPRATDHIPVLAAEVRELLEVHPGQTIVDATFGAGGHAELLARDLHGDGRLIAVDVDPDVRPYFERFRRKSGGISTRLLRGNFSVVLRQLADNDVEVDAILLDLGVSSMQLDRSERGFSYAADSALDMRMDPSAETSAREFVNDVSERAFQLEGTGQWVKGKSADTFGPIGPWLVTAEEVPDPQTLGLWLEVDGHRYQNGSTATMVFGVAHLVTYLSRFMSLQPGDIISTGTPPGVGLGQKPPVYLRPGNVMRLGIEGLGKQRQTVVPCSFR